MTWINSCYYGLLLLRTYGHFMRSQRHNFLVFSLIIVDTEQHLGIFAHISSLFFSVFWDCLSLFWLISASSSSLRWFKWLTGQTRFLLVNIRKLDLQSFALTSTFSKDLPSLYESRWVSSDRSLLVEADFLLNAIYS